MDSAAQDPAKPEGAIRIATFNAAMNRKGAGELVQLLRLGGDKQISAVTEILLRVRPDILLINEIDRDDRGLAADLYAGLLRQGQEDLPGIDYPHVLAPPVNTGEPSGLDLDRDGVSDGPGDAFGWGAFPGQYGMAVFSRFPIDDEAVRTFQKLLWMDAPGALLPLNKDGTPYYDEKTRAILRLSSKTHLDAPILLPDGREIHLLASHPTPPVFDGPEDRNGRRNQDEIRFWVDYLNEDGWMYDDRGATGGLAADASFIVIGDLNNDPFDGDGDRDPILSLLTHSRVADPAPVSEGGREAGAFGLNRDHLADPAQDTADWPDKRGRGPGNLRVDYVLPSRDLDILGSGVFWPASDDPLRRLVGKGGRIVSSDHRLVWVDIAVGAPR